MERFFKLREYGTTIRTEIMAGLTTFMTMAYILAVNPNILGSTGMDTYSVFLATALAAGIFTICMGLFVNFPVALAPGMGLNAYFAAVVTSGQGFTWQMALTAVFISGLIFLLLTVTKIRQMLLYAIPDSIKFAITVGIGLFITIVGLKTAGVMHITPDGIIDLGSLSEPSVLLTIVGVLIIAILMVLNVKGAILIGILATTVIAILAGQVEFSSLTSADNHWIPDFSKLEFMAFDWSGILSAGILTAIFTFTFVELFDTFGTLVGTANRAGFLKNKEEGYRRVGNAMLVDSISVAGGAMLGTSTVTAYVESSSGIAQGGRTGLTAVTTGVCFLLAIFLAPIALLIPAAATSAALIVVGLLMVQGVREIDFTDLVNGVPAFLTIIFMPFTYNIANGISFGIVSYVVLALINNVFNKDKKYKIHWLLWILAALIILRYLFI